ncbi:aminotransferase-like domain-containing protein [Verminephrobacter aporrectodeae]|uniref:aminotransferase-like domain-containing protein n=1 Tax=Verminephrobacter aporrectodeae TaxID=1110389 RepID=UPI0022385692|nr:PLP-dependent aminotransferase family protein [Verminephrobacter aporrectodeae]MCW5256349.1 PLP-dependent aminotransferase family protein [Verminephrobacter aporrectodeae subsp. tuberculatae]MCW8174304.1 PLP-dependent aminotransferase family protein [Verminephrobacter aporrectodeae subsp. tuberculatae]MCW8202152.1 PLP-dependent aminotransferase family protein [Verminephrobacter aporrectodeae subsp. tuberculatae]
MLPDDDAPALYLQIAEQLARLIRNGALARGARLPSVRALARQHGVAQSTVVQAYHWLEDARLVSARPRSGFFVAAPVVSLPEPSTPRPMRRPREVTVDYLGQRILGHKQPEEIVSFSNGTPGIDLLDPDRVRRAVSRAVQRHRNLLCIYPWPSGHEDARRALARYAVSLGCGLDPENIVLTSGCMESVALCLRAVTQPGDVVALESPTHFSFLELLRDLHLRALEIPTHARHGLSLDALQLALDTQPVKATLVVPTLSNPLGSCMPQAGRKRLAQMAARHGMAVIEDAIYNDLVEVDEMRRSVKSYDSTGHVMLCDSFSKTLAPGLRLGWLEGGRWAERLRAIKGLQVGGQSAVLELALADLISQAGHAAAMRQLRAAAAARVSTARHSIATHFPQGTRVSDPPGGLLLWLELPRALDTVQLHQACLAERILIAPGSVFSASGRFRNCLRIGVGDWSPAHWAALRTVGELACGMLRSPPLLAA